MTTWCVQGTDGTTTVEADEFRIGESGSLVFLRATADPPAPLTPVLALSARLWRAVYPAGSPITSTAPDTRSGESPPRKGPMVLPAVTDIPDPLR
jgi:hypothetical protein